MKKFIYLFVLSMFLFACEKADIEQYPITAVEETDIDDSNDLDAEEAAFLLESKSEIAQSRHDVPEVFSIETERISVEEMCYDKYQGYIKYPYNQAQRFVLTGKHFTADQGTSTIEASIRFNKVDEAQALQVVSWSDTEIVVDVTNPNMEYKNVLLKFYLKVPHEGKIRTVRKSTRVSSGLPYTLDGVTEMVYYPSRFWQIAYWQQVNQETIDIASYQKVQGTASNPFGTQRYVAQVGDILLAGTDRIAYVIEIRERRDNGNDKIRLHQRNKKCFGRSNKRTYTTGSPGRPIYPKADEPLFTTLYRPTTL